MSVRFLLIVFCGVMGFAQPPAGNSSDPAADLLRQGRQKMSEGKPDEALAIYKQAAASFPNSVGANNQAGVVLDLMGQYSKAKKFFPNATDTPAPPQAKGQAQRAMAMSYAFEGDCKNAAKYEGPLYQL